MTPTNRSKKRGRKSLLDAKLQKQICDLLTAGNTIRTVADAVGISERVYFEWVERNPHFAQATTRARATAKIKLVSIITEAAKTDARHACWLLERSHPQEYGRATKPPPPQPEPENSYLSDKELSEILDSIDASQKQLSAAETLPVLRWGKSWQKV